MRKLLIFGLAALMSFGAHADEWDDFLKGLLDTITEPEFTQTLRQSNPDQSTQSAYTELYKYAKPAEASQVQNFNDIGKAQEEKWKADCIKDKTKIWKNGNCSSCPAPNVPNPDQTDCIPPTLTQDQQELKTKCESTTAVASGAKWNDSARTCDCADRTKPNWNLTNGICEAATPTLTAEQQATKTKCDTTAATASGAKWNDTTKACDCTDQAKPNWNLTQGVCEAVATNEAVSVRVPFQGDDMGMVVNMIRTNHAKRGLPANLTIECPNIFMDNDICLIATADYNQLFKCNIQNTTLFHERLKGTTYVFGTCPGINKNYNLRFLSNAVGNWIFINENSLASICTFTPSGQLRSNLNNEDKNKCIQALCAEMAKSPQRTEAQAAYNANRSQCGGETARQTFNNSEIQSIFDRLPIEG
jgi:hypothetical protein